MKNHIVSALVAIALCSISFFLPSAEANGWRHHGRHGRSMSCEDLANLNLQDTVITMATSVYASEEEPFTVSSTAGTGTVSFPFCRVAGTVDPEINFEIWIPLEDWNGKLNGVGLGVYLGGIGYAAMATSIQRGYATVSTDAGHQSEGVETAWAIDNPDAIVSLGYRAHHEMTVKAKAIIKAFAGHGPRYSYFTGCSSGGWQGLTEAQRYPEDYNGILAGAPAINVVHLHAGSIWNHLQTRQIAPEKFGLVYESVIAACDADDGVIDGLVENPMDCDFDPAVLQCTGGDPVDCLTDAEVEAFQQIYEGTAFEDGEPIYPGWPLTSEDGLGLWANPYIFVPFVFGTFRDLAYNGGGPSGIDPYTVNEFDFDRDVTYADETIGSIMNSNDPDLSEFRKHGGKVLLYHGWSDILITANNTVEYYERVVDTVGRQGKGKRHGDRHHRKLLDTQKKGRRHGDRHDHKLFDTQKFARLFMVPGMGHCGGGTGVSDFDGLAALEKWVERNDAPDEIIASNPNTGMTRPLCPYPQTAHYKGSGDVNDAANFFCSEDDF